jgi:menaquinone-dependent protoporphyrinogen oxidase
MKDAVEFVHQFHAELRLHPVWLFSSGPTGPEQPRAEADPRQIPQIEQAIHPREHRVFYGALDPDKLSFLERAVVKGVKAPTGDFRDWDDIDAWAGSIAESLRLAEAPAN